MNLIFLNPLFLIGLPTALIPVLLHLFVRQKTQVVPFGSLRFVRAAESEQRRRFRLQHILLLAIRTLIILFLVLSFSRPVLESGLLTASGGVRSVCVVLDDSFSMGYSERGKTLFEEAKEEALRILSSLPPGSDAAVIFPNKESKVEGLRIDIEDVIQDVEGAEVSFGSMGVRDSIRKAYDLLRKSLHPLKEVYVISDGTAFGFRDIEKVSHDADVYVHIITLRPRAEGQNCAITDVDLSPSFIYPGKRVEFEVMVRNFSSQDISGLELSFWINGVKRGRQNFSMSGDEKRGLHFKYCFQKPGFYDCKFRLTGDNLLEDNTFFTSIEVKRRLQVVVITRKGMGEEELYLIHALAPLQFLRQGPIDVKLRHPREVKDERSLSGIDCVILKDLQEFPSLHAIECFLKAGGGLIIFLDRVGSVETQLEDTFDSVLPCSIGDLKEERCRPLANPLLGHPVFKPFSGFQRAFDKVCVFRFRKVTMKPGAAALARFAHGAPSIIERALGKGRVILIPFGLSRKSTDFPLKPVFAPLLYQLVLYATGNAMEPEVLRVGDDFIRSLTLREFREQLHLIHPSGKKEMLNYRMHGDCFLFERKGLATPGIYRVLLEKSEEERFCVNVCPSESDLNVISWEEIREKFQGVHVDFSHRGGGKGFGAKPERRDISRVFLLLVVLLVIPEMVLSNPGKVFRREG